MRQSLLQRHLKLFYLFVFINIQLVISCSIPLFRDAKIKRNNKLSDCDILDNLKVNYRNGFIEKESTKKVEIEEIGENTFKITQDSLQVFIEKDTVGFNKLFLEGMIHCELIHENVREFNPWKYQEKNLPRIKYTYTIYGVKELVCTAVEETKQYKFYACRGDYSTNGIYFYSEFHFSENHNSQYIEKNFLLGYGFSI